MAESNPKSRSESETYQLEDLLYLMSRLRDPVDGCPWDRQQDFKDIVPYTLEECYELADAIANEDYPHIKEELGDVLFQVVFYAQLSMEQQYFDFHSVIDALVTKLVRRHPHVFPDGNLRSRFGEQSAEMNQIKQTWESLKAEERASKFLGSVLDDVPVALPALTRAMKLQKRAARVGFDWSDAAAVLPHIKSEVDELLEVCQGADQQHIEEEFGDLMFCLVNLGRHLNVDPETSMRSANRKFERRFHFIEQSLAEGDSEPAKASLAEMDALWDEAKKQGL